MYMLFLKIGLTLNRKKLVFYTALIYPLPINVHDLIFENYR